jgi:hypothetical protein
MVGFNDKISEPETAILVMQPREKCLLSMDLVSPASKFKTYEPMFNKLMATFEVYECPVLK